MEDKELLKSENGTLRLALTKACKMLDETGYCYNKGHCSSVKGDCVDCLRKHFIACGFKEMALNVKKN